MQFEHFIPLLYAGHCGLLYPVGITTGERGPCSPGERLVVLLSLALGGGVGPGHARPVLRAHG